jgi:hypothetical protein
MWIGLHTSHIENYRNILTFVQKRPSDLKTNENNCHSELIPLLYKEGFSECHFLLSL